MMPARMATHPVTMVTQLNTITVVSPSTMMTIRGIVQPGKKHIE